METQFKNLLKGNKQKLTSRWRVVLNSIYWFCNCTTSMLARLVGCCLFTFTLSTNFTKFSIFFQPFEEIACQRGSKICRAFLFFFNLLIYIVVVPSPPFLLRKKEMKLLVKWEDQKYKCHHRWKERVRYIGIWSILSCPVVRGGFYIWWWPLGGPNDPASLHSTYYTPTFFNYYFFPLPHWDLTLLSTYTYAKLITARINSALNKNKYWSNWFFFFFENKNKRGFNWDYDHISFQKVNLCFILAYKI